jgi:hypothetical protein
MNSTSVKIGLGLFGLIATMSALLMVKSDLPLGARIVAVDETAAGKKVTVEFQRRDPRAQIEYSNEVRIRVAGRWQEPKPFPEVGDRYLFHKLDTEQFVLTFPAETEACRFSLGYRSGPNLYCRAYFFLFRQGIVQRFPNASKLVLKPIPKQPRLRHAEFELVIPPASHLELAQDQTLGRIQSR